MSLAREWSAGAFRQDSRTLPVDAARRALIVAEQIEQTLGPRD